MPDGPEIKIADLSRVALEPGDKLLLRSDGVLTQAQVGLANDRPGHMGRA